MSELSKDSEDIFRTNLKACLEDEMLIDHIIEEIKTAYWLGWNDGQSSMEPMGDRAPEPGYRNKQ